ncbi:hypothetical protein C8J38_12017 [Rhizobium sp. PP-WC-2G-219]|nr:hypothetical protein C8J38_12017 [Rhizobium sp. PP-WC-2G-219]
MNVADELNAKKATPETILQILDSSVFEVSGDLSPDEMMANLRAAVDDPESIDEALGALRARPELVNEIALLWLSEASQTPDMKNLVSDVIKDADRQLPMMEIGALTLVALYALYILGPSKSTKEKVLIKQRPDGTFETIERTTENADFSQPVRGFISLFSGRGKNKG